MKACFVGQIYLVFLEKENFIPTSVRGLHSTLLLFSLLDLQTSQNENNK
jgi:hypothetical protein